ncbi:MAG: nucleotidyltransferase family protein [Kofleriaceae bacterium]|nr:nucleotidyltransferase family protein [Kofleriaceae bacterium]
MPSLSPEQGLAQLIRHANGIDCKPAHLSPSLVRRQRLGPLAYSLGFSEFKRDFVEHALFADLRKMELSKLFDLLAEKEIRVSLLKGISYCKTIYADPAERSMGDVDLLVEPSNFSAAKSLIEASGYAARTNPKEASSAHHAVTLDKGKLTIDLHRHIFQPGRSSVDMKGMWDRAEHASDWNLNVYRLCAEDELILHLLHIARSEFMVSAISYVDIPRLEKRAGLTRAQLLRIAKEYRIQRALKSVLDLSDAIHEMPIHSPKFSRSRQRSWQLLPSPNEVLGLAPLSRARRILLKASLSEGFQELIGFGHTFLAEQREIWQRSRRE